MLSDKDDIGYSVLEERSLRSQRGVAAVKEERLSEMQSYFTARSFRESYIVYQSGAL